MRLIDGDVLMEAPGIAVECKDCSRNGAFGCKEDSAFVYACEAITDAQTIDAVEVVRCRDCEYGEQDDVGRWSCRSLGCQVGDEDGSGFCADGERREDGKQ